MHPRDRDLDLLLDVEVEAEPTARTFPQLLTWNALPPAGSSNPYCAMPEPEIPPRLPGPKPSGKLAACAAARLCDHPGGPTAVG